MEFQVIPYSVDAPQAANPSGGGGLPDRVGSEGHPRVGAGSVARPQAARGRARPSSRRAPAREVGVRTGGAEE